ncbi:hypothetical protein N7451_012357 [Penicillium sp. IBT 35674x]|nr:hypothetical protein N7451_012357 [Penicillium sp. IBT 35674x]
MVVTARIAAKFNSYYAEKPCKAAANHQPFLNVLGGVADTIAQLISTAKPHSMWKVPVDDNQLTPTKFLDQDEGEVSLVEQLAHPKTSPVSFDFERVTRFMAFGFLMAPIQLKWFGFLASTLPLTLNNPTVPVLKRVALDQLVFAPFGLACFFTFMSGVEGGTQKALKQKFSDVYLTTLKANYILWPSVQLLNFRVIPLQYQIPFVSSVGIAWTAYLSLANSSE